MSLKAVLATNAVYKIGNVGVLFLTTAILSRAMGAEGFGVLSLLILNVTLFNMLTSFGIDSGITYVTASQANMHGRVAGISVVVVVLQVLLLLLADTICVGLTGHHLLHAAGGSQAAWLSIIFLIGLSMQEKFTALLNGSHLYTQCNQVIFIVNAISLLLFGFFFFVVRSTAISLYVGLYIGTSLLLAVALFALSKHLLHWAFAFSISKKALASFFTYSTVVFLTNLVQFLAYRADLWLVAFFRSDAEVGWYALAVRLVQLFWILPLLFASIVFPVVSRAQCTYDHRQIFSLLRGMNGFNAVAGIFALILVGPLLPFLFGAEYSPAVASFRILLPGVIMFSNATVLAAYFAGMNRLKVNLWGSVLCLATVGLLDLLLIPSMGQVGAAFASTIGYSLTAIYFIVLFNRQTGVGIAGLLFPQRGDWQQLRAYGQTLFSFKP